MKVISSALFLSFLLSSQIFADELSFARRLNKFAAYNDGSTHYIITDDWNENSKWKFDMEYKILLKNCRILENNLKIDQTRLDSFDLYYSSIKDKDGNIYCRNKASLLKEEVPLLEFKEMAITFRDSEKEIDQLVLSISSLAKDQTLRNEKRTLLDLFPTKRRLNSCLLIYNKAREIDRNFSGLSAAAYIAAAVCTNDMLRNKESFVSESFASKLSIQGDEIGDALVKAAERMDQLEKIGNNPSGGSSDSVSFRLALMLSKHKGASISDLGDIIKTEVAAAKSIVTKDIDQKDLNMIVQALGSVSGQECSELPEMTYENAKEKFSRLYPKANFFYLESVLNTSKSSIISSYQEALKTKASHETDIVSCSETAQEYLDVLGEKKEKSNQSNEVKE